MINSINKNIFNDNIPNDKLNNLKKMWEKDIENILINNTNKFMDNLKDIPKTKDITKSKSNVI